ncbi:MAG: inorganic phosphate transporter [Verrucomicrobia bacterium]|nr:inorganic phosphate transporter [Verrucomicrobiota bacterium]
MSLAPIDLVVLIVILGLLFDYTNGFHDAANVVSTVIATRVLAPLSAIVLASFLNMLGATQISGVAKTITTGLVDLHSATQITVLCALAGAIIWNFLTWYFGIPSSSSYALVGGLIGASWVHEGVGVIIWSGLLYKVVIPMVLSPIAGFLLGFLVLKGLNKLMKFPFFKRREGMFAHLQIASASLVALSHGLNDAQKSMGIITLGLYAGGLIAHPHIPLWVIAACAIVMGLGTASGGFRIIRTVGYEITKLHPLQGFAAETSASCVILTASFLGMPISSTHMIVGSVTGVGMAKGPSRVRWSTGKKMTLAWVLTLPGSALLAALAYQAIKFFIQPISV